MVITKTPYRISLFGGGTDFPAYFNQEGRTGMTLSFATQYHSYISLRHIPPFEKERYRIRYSVAESWDCVNQICHPVVREALKMLRFYQPIEIVHSGDLPSKTGIGSSSAFAIGLLKGLHQLGGQETGRRQICEEAIELERDILQEAGGWQDQIICANGSLLRTNYDDKHYRTQPMHLKRSSLKQWMSKFLLVYTRQTRMGHQIEAQKEPMFRTKLHVLDEIKSLVDPAITCMVDDNYDEFGKLLHKSWKLKRELSRYVSTKQIDDLYYVAKQNGALGGKLLGSGSGGFLLLFSHDIKRLEHQFKHHTTLRVDIDHEGTRVIHESANPSWKEGIK